MYPDRELIRLTLHKAALRRRITLRRTECAVAAAAVGQPLAWLDRLLALWRQLSPLLKIAAVPAGFLLGRSVRPRSRLLGTLLRWSPLLVGAWRSFTAGRHRTRTRDA